MYSRAYLKNHSCNLHAPIYGIFCLHSVAVARYAAFIQAKSPANCDVHLAESVFQTRSSFYSVCLLEHQRISEKFEKVNQNNILLYYIMEKLIFLQIHNILENPQILQLKFWFSFSDHCQPPKRAYPLYLWPRSKVWMRVH